MSTPLLVRNAEVEGVCGLDVAVDGSTVVEVAAGIEAGRDAEVLDAGGGALLPGLHDHHVHLRSLAAARSSVRVGPPQVDDADALATSLRRADARARRGAWIRAVGYHESVAGALDAGWLDAVVRERPVRVQHRSGALWILNTAGLHATGFDASADPRVERDDRGAPTGRLWRMDRELSRRTPPVAVDYRELAHEAASRGVTGFTDADPERSDDDVSALRAAVDRGELPQRLHLMGPPGLGVGRHPRLGLGPVKIVLDDARLPGLAELVSTVEAARSEQRPVAVHCVTRAQLTLALAALDEAGSLHGDRIEHAAVAPPELVAAIRRLGLTVVIQPNFVAERGDQYLSDVDADDLSHLHRCGSLLDEGVGVAAGTDAPYGDPDPWRAVVAATSRTTPSGVPLGPEERISGPRALRLFLGAADDPASARRVRSGAPADLCLLAVPLAEALRSPSGDHVVATVVGGEVAWSDDRR